MKETIIIRKTVPTIDPITSKDIQFKRTNFLIWIKFIIPLNKDTIFCIFCLYLNQDGQIEKNLTR